MQERLAIQPADPAAARGERLLNEVGDKRHRSFEWAHVALGTDHVALGTDHVALGTDHVTTGELVWGVQGDRKNDSTVAFLLSGHASYIMGAGISVAHGYLAT